jgi:hypothetical protein
MYFDGPTIQVDFGNRAQDAELAPRRSAPSSAGQSGQRASASDGVASGGAKKLTAGLLSADSGEAQADTSASDVQTAVPPGAAALPVLPGQTPAEQATTQSVRADRRPARSAGLADATDDSGATSNQPKANPMPVAVPIVIPPFGFVPPVQVGAKKNPGRPAQEHEEGNSLGQLLQVAAEERLLEEIDRYGLRSRGDVVEQSHSLIRLRFVDASGIARGVVAHVGHGALLPSPLMMIHTAAIVYPEYENGARYRYVYGSHQAAACGEEEGGDEKVALAGDEEGDMDSPLHDRSKWAQ